MREVHAGHDLPRRDIRRGWLEGENHEKFLRDLELIERLRFLADGRTMAQAALACVLAHPAVSTTIPGAKKPQQVKDNVQSSARSLSQGELKQVQEVMASQ